VVRKAGPCKWPSSWRQVRKPIFNQRCVTPSEVEQVGRKIWKAQGYTSRRAWACDLGKLIPTGVTNAGLMPAEAALRTC